MTRSCNVAVIGAGISGLSAARELRREGHRAVVFEKGDRIGGTWVYDPRADSDESGRVHGSLYRSLRTNLPRELMEFLDFPFDRSYGDPRTFPAHGEVLAFLEDFAREFGVVEAVRLRAEVVRVAAREGEWVVEWRREGEQEVAEVFQAVVICSGHHAEPRLAEIPGIDGWPGKQFHSHNYRIPEPFRDQIVVMIGKGPSEYDISIEISKVAKEVHLASRSLEIKVGKLDGHDNIWQHPMIKCAHEDGKVEFDDGSLLVADIIFHCTGYHYCFPFLETNGIVSVDDNRVGPLYKHVFPPHLAPWISFVGLPNKGPIFLMIELQTKWVAQILSGKVSLPPEKDMMSYIDQIYLEMENAGKPKRHTHTLYPKAIEYVNWLAVEAGLPPLEWRKEQTYLAALECLLSRDDGYRDTWDAKRIQSCM